MQENQFLEFTGGSSSLQAFPNYLICKRLMVNTVLVQGRSHRYGWHSFIWTTFQGNNHISAIIIQQCVWQTGKRPRAHS